jgi:hypothetical protein
MHRLRLCSLKRILAARDRLDRCDTNGVSQHLNEECWTKAFESRSTTSTIADVAYMASNPPIYKCLIISPGDVQAERKAVVEVFGLWDAHIGETLQCRVEAITWETHSVPDASASPQQVLNRQIVDSADLAIAIFWSRIGTPTETHVSGSAEEIERLLERGARVLVYFNDADIPQHLLQDRQYRDLIAFKERLGKRALVGRYSSVPNLTQQVLLHVTRVLVTLQPERLGLPSITGDPLTRPVPVETKGPSISVRTGTPEWVRPLPFDGMGEAIARVLAEQGGRLPTRRLAVPDVIIVNLSEQRITLTLRLLVRRAGQEFIGKVRQPKGDVLTPETDIPYPIVLQSGDAVEGRIVFDVPLPNGDIPSGAEFLLELTDRLQFDRMPIHVPLPGTFPLRTVLPSRAARSSQVSVSSGSTRPSVQSISAQMAIDVGFVGSPLALALVIRNRTHEILQQAKVVLEDLRKWDPDHKEFIQVREYHKGGVFRPRALVGPNQFFPGADEAFQFLHLTPHGFVCEGPPIGSARKALRVNGQGLWMATFDVGHARSSCLVELFFERPESGGPPTPAEDPRR